MLTLATHQSSIWGYSALTHTLSNLGNFSASFNYTGTFTKPTLAPNGKMYSIMTCRSCDISGVTKTSVILEITPGTSNTATTNYSIPTVNYIVADTGLSENQAGFAQANFPEMAPPNSGNNGIRFNTGILAPNGLIYFPPVDNQAGTNKWVVFNPTSGRWKLMNLHPNYAESPTISIPNAAITAAVLGTDGKIYVFGYGNSTGTLVPYYRFTPTTNASGDVASLQTGYYQNLSLNSTPLCSTNLQWKDSAGTSYIDIPPASGTLKAYANTAPAGQAYNKIKIFIDIIVHPSGRIYFIPGPSSSTNNANTADVGRGRIFYLDINAWGSATEIVSATGLVAPGGKRISAHYAFLEKPRNADHDITTLKIYIVPAPRLGASTTVCTEVLCINPTTNTITEIPFTFTTDTNLTGIGKRVSLSNGLNLFYNAGSGAGNSATIDRSGGHLLTGWDIPASDTDGAIAIDTIAKGILHNTLPAAFTSFDPGYTLIGGGVNATYPHHSKFIGNPAPTNTISELVSVKQYGPDITNFNFTDRDKPSIAPPSNLEGLPLSLFNSNFNKPK
jgi:hypothetical protein